MKIIDAHQHFWDPSRGDYHWMPQDNPILNRKYEVRRSYLKILSQLIYTKQF